MAADLPSARTFAAASALSFGGIFTLFVLAHLDIEPGAGVGVGDELREVADKLLITTRPSDEVSRIAANEFALLTDQGARAAAELTSLLERALSGTTPRASTGWSAYP